MIRYCINIVGAGPGDPELLTRRAFARIAEADLVLRDLLVPDALLAATGTRAEVVDVGRRCGAAENQAQRQARINGLMRDGWQAGRRVVRLKSGDPLVFGRAAEEAAYLDAHGIPFAFVPGVTAGLAAASLAGVPLTERHRASAVLFCTGHLAGDDAVPVAEWAALLTGGTTLVLYMGLRALSVLAPRLRAALAEGVAVDVTVVSRVSLPGQLQVTAPLAGIEAALAGAGLEPPVVCLLTPGRPGLCPGPAPRAQRAFGATGQWTP